MWLRSIGEFGFSIFGSTGTHLYFWVGAVSAFLHGAPSSWDRDWIDPGRFSSDIRPPFACLWRLWKMSLLKHCKCMYKHWKKSNCALKILESYFLQAASQNRQIRQAKKVRTSTWRRLPPCASWCCFSFWKKNRLKSVGHTDVFVLEGVGSN